VRFEHVDARLHPPAAPRHILFLVDLVVIGVVGVADVERRVGEHQIGHRLAPAG